MVYIGRVVGVGRNSLHEPTIVYAVSGRSTASMERRATMPDEYTVHIGPLHNEDSDPLRHYDAIRLSDGLGVVSNGRHTDDIFSQCQEIRKPDEILKSVLELFGPEPDEYHTPRIAGILRFDKDDPCDSIDCCLGMVSEKGVSIARPLPAFADMLSGEILGTSTYMGDRGDKKKIIVPDALPILQLPSKYLVDTTADALYKWMDSDFVVCTAAAVWKDGKWELAVRNLHE